MTRKPIVFDSNSYIFQCFDVESIFEGNVHDHEAGADDEEIRSSSQAVVAGFLQGHCIGEPSLPMKSAFTDAVFDDYATSGVITEEGRTLSLGITSEDWDLIWFILFDEIII